MNDFDLSMRIGGRFKLLENFSENLMYLPELSDLQFLLLHSKPASQSLEVEFDQ